MLIISKLINRHSHLTIKILSTIIMLIALSDTFLLPKLTTRFCYNSPEPSRVSSQCVLCNYFLFDATVMGCTGSTALSVNITATQAFCLISQCLGQIRQTPMFLGRKRRSVNGDDDEQSDVDQIVSLASNYLPLINEKTESTNDDQVPEIIEYNSDGLKQQFTIKNDVEATIIDLIALDDSQT
ncbi:uncharacterized protein LOC128392221 [Panonychus citri]|uniref:uncharacterized protein LOC128392221 n=1 Tax=Panonychus citri TaxID=50023 RepID=UPI00230780BB|nr:uncharacterized protein LOC128392221 [Panonychus citri]